MRLAHRASIGCPPVEVVYSAAIMRLACPSCGAAIPAEDVNVVRMVAKCRACHAVFRFDAQLTGAPAPAAPLAPALAVALPPGIVVDRAGGPMEGDYRTPAGGVGELTITRRWFSPQTLFLLFFAIAWDSFLIFWYSAAITQGGPWIMFVFPIAHLAAGVWVTHTALSGLLNRTVLRIADGRLRVTHGPIPVRGNRDLPVDEVRQLYTEEVAGSKGSKRYTLHAVVATGPAIALASDLESSQQALFLERTIEEHLRLPDQPVAGSFRG